MAGSKTKPAKGLSSREGRFCRAKIQRRWRMILSSRLSPGTGILAILALCHGAPSGNLESRSASKGCTNSCASCAAGSSLAASDSKLGTGIACTYVGAGQPSPLLARRQRQRVADSSHL
eukprot:2608475-Amphidinium_carterae.2